jgi:anti-anti-sigma regulatory factor
MAKQTELSEEMYRRIYRLIKRQVDPRVIATTVNIPLRTIEGIVSRFEKNLIGELGNIEELSNTSEANEDKEFLDIYVYTKTRYAIIQVVGILTSEHKDVFSQELDKVYETSFKAFAIRMSDVTEIDEIICKLIIKYYEKFQSYNRYLALLDPAPEIEVLLTQFHIDTVVPIFGTERAFEDSAFSRKASTVIKRSF